MLYTSLPISKRKFNVVSTSASPLNSLETKEYYIRQKISMDTSEGPSRFDLPELEELTLGVFSSFDDITYNTQPIIQAPEKNTDRKRMNEEIFNEDISNVFLSHNEIPQPQILNKKEDALDDDWAFTDENLKYENFRISPMKKFKFDFNNKEGVVKHFVSNHNHSSKSASTVSFDNHAKIIREVLKKYPHLVQHNKNIRLKIMQREARNTDNASGKTKISYVELKSDFLTLNTSDEANTSNIINSQSANNDIGPWKCTRCTLNEEYIDYYMYRRHMQDVHGERFDPRICEHCGYKATKRNILMYHMYTKHNVPPPKNMSFPKCDMCPYIALSESLLVRHQVNHKHLSKKNLHSLNASGDQTTNDADTISDYAQLAYKKRDDEEFCTKIDQQFFHCFNCDQQFSEINNFKVHLHSHQKSLKDIVQNSSSLSATSSSENITCSINEFLEKSEFNSAYKKEIAQIQQQVITDFVDTNPENEVVMLIENDEDNTQIYSDEFTENNKILENNGANTIVYIRKVQRDNEEKSSSNISDDKYIYNIGNAEVVEEVVEELETLEDEHNYEKLNKDFNIGKRENIIQPCINSSNKKVVLSQVNNLIQYVEEETEILEYETNADV